MEVSLLISDSNLGFLWQLFELLCGIWLDTETRGLAFHITKFSGGKMSPTVKYVYIFQLVCSQGKDFSLLFFLNFLTIGMSLTSVY